MGCTYYSQRIVKDMSSILITDYRQQIKDLRETRGLTQTQFAELVGVSFATVNRTENWENDPCPLSYNPKLSRVDNAPIQMSFH